VGEVIYELAQTQIAEQGLPTKAIGRWFPYVASLFLFILTMNLLGFIPLPLTGDQWLGVRTGGIYAVTSQLSVTLVLALLSVVFSHIEGVRYNGWKHFNFLPSGLPPWSAKTAVPLALMYLLELISQVFRIISLSVRLYANMLAGHILILVSIGLLFILSGLTFWIVAIFALPIGIAFYIFEVAIVVTIQAFIFAALTAIYIGTAIEPDH
jgi:F-type H+-transporting ATPase subunit a